MLIIQSKRNKQLYPQLKVLGRGYHENAIERDRNHVPLEPKHAAEIAFLRTDDKQTALYVCTYLPTSLCCTYCGAGVPKFGIHKRVTHHQRGAGAGEYANRKKIYRLDVIWSSVLWHWSVWRVICLSVLSFRHAGSTFFYFLVWHGKWDMSLVYEHFYSYLLRVFFLLFYHFCTWHYA